jgi:PAS domain S-box-containing protein
MDELMMPLALLAAPSPAAVLVVDDNAGKRLAVRQMLAPLRHAVVEADSGRAAVLAVTQQSFAVILMDVSMPILDGYQTAKLIRERTESASTPIIFLTAYGRDETETASAYASGAVDFIFTPVLAAVLRAKVAAFIHLFVQSRELQRSLESITALNGALHDSEAHARAVLQNVADGIVTAGETGLIESFNRSAQRLFGYKEFEVIGQPLRRVIAPNADDAASELATTEAVGRRKDGSCFPMEINTSLVNIGERMLTIGCIRDISARNEQVERERERQNTLRRDALRDRLAFEAAPIGGIITARDGTIERVNQAMCDMTGYTADELIGTPCSELAHQDERQHGSVVVDALLSGRSDTERFDQRYLHRSGRIIEARVALTTIRDEHDEVAQLFGQIEDVTEARRTSRELEEAQFEMLTRLAAAAEFRDDDTGQHTRRVGDLSVTIAQHLELPEAEIELIRLAAPLHDLGKIAIPDAILGKPGELTVEEYDRMKAHTTIGAEMLGGSPFALLQMAEQIALTHHEKWDGSGYPGGLAGGAIPIAGRIVAVADVFDALTHSRPYKAAWSTADAIAEIESQSGRHFDPRVLEAFLSGSPRAQPESEPSAVAATAQAA